MAGYDAFISYSHSTDDRLAPAIRDGLQKLGKPWNKRRALNIFLDKSSLEISAGLKDSLHAKLEGTEWLILLMSEASARSEWVGEEIVNWAATKPVNRIALVQTDGELYWGDGDWDWARSTSAPRALAGVYTEEPLWLDLRKYRDEPDLDIRSNNSFKDDLATLAAPLHGKSKEELVGEDLVQFRRAKRMRRAAVAGLAVLTVLAVTAASVAIKARDEAIKEAKVATTRQLAAQALVESRDQPDLGLLLAVAAHDLGKELLAAGDIPVPLDGPRAALQQILEATPQLVSYLTGFSDRPTALAGAPGLSRLAVGEKGGAVSLWDTSTLGRGGPFEKPRRLTPPPGVMLEDEITAMAFNEGATVLAAGSAKGDVVVWEIDSGRIVKIHGAELSGDRDGESPVTGIVFDAATRRVAVAFRLQVDTGFRRNITVRDTGSGSRIGDDLEDFFSVDAMQFEGPDLLAVIDHGTLRSCEIGRGCDDGMYVFGLPRPGAVTYDIAAGVGAGSHFNNGGVLTGRLDNELMDGHVQLPAGIISGMAFSPDGKVLTMVQEATMSFWDPLAEHKSAGPGLRGVAPGESTHIVFLSRDGLLLATLADGKVQLWDRGREGRLGERLPVRKLELGSVIDSLVSADFSPDGQRVAWIIDPVGDMRCRDEFTRTEMWTPDTVAHYRSLQAGLEGLCELVEGQTVAVWSRDTGRIVTLSAGLEQKISFLDDGRIATDYGEVWDVDNRVRSEGAEPGCFDSDRRWTQGDGGEFTRCEGGVRVRAEFGVFRNLVAGTDLVGAALSMNTRALAVLDQPAAWQVTVWRIDESGDVSSSVIDLGEEAVTLNQWGRDGEKPSLVLGPQGRVLAADYYAGGFSFWSTERGSRLLSIPRDAIEAFVFSPDGKLLALDRLNGDIELRETTTLNVVGVLQGEGDATARILKFSPDGEVLMAARAGGGMTLWDVNDGSWRRRACALVGRTLDEDERHRFDPASRQSEPTLLDWLTKAGKVALDPCAS